jgi:hypothetical protein
MRDLDSWFLYCQMHLLEGAHEDKQAKEVECACVQLLREEAMSQTEPQTKE